MIKKAVFIIGIVMTMLSGIVVGAAEYKNETFSLNYDENNFLVCNVGGEVIHYSVCRLCPYTAKWNDEYRDIYRSIRLSSSDSDDREEEQTEKTEEAYDFGNTAWGMSKEDVKQLEGKPVFENEMEVWYEGIAAEKHVDILYQFDQDKLINGTYFFTDKHADLNYYYKDYFDLVYTYSGKFGEPVKQAEQWRQDRYRYDRTKLGTAIAAGHVSFITQWETDTSSIMVKLYGDDHEIKLIAFYEDKKVNTNGT